MTRVALVTGAARGIGARVVVELARQGWAVVALDRDGDDARLAYRLGTRLELEQVVAEAGALAPGGTQVLAKVGDACDLEVVTEAVELAESSFGGLDAVVAAAGVIAGGVPLWEMPLDVQDAVLDVDLRAVLVAARAGIPALLRRPEPRQGRFLAVASAAATRGLPMLAAYCAAKAGVVGLVRALALELAASGVTANAVSPGSTETAMLAETARLYGLAAPGDFAAQQPVGRLLEPDEIAAVLVWLASPASSAITGANIAADGGLSI